MLAAEFLAMQAGIIEQSNATLVRYRGHDRTGRSA